MEDQDHVDHSRNFTESSHLAEDTNISADAPDQNGGSGTTETGTKEMPQEPSSDDNGSNVDNDEEPKGEENEHLEMGDERSLNDEDDPEKALEVIKRQETHNLYCPNCTHTITKTAKLYKKGEESSRYKDEGFALRFVFVFSFKFPFIHILWLSPDEPDKKEKKHVLDQLRFLLIAVLLVLLAIVFQVQTYEPQPLPSPPHNPNGSIAPPPTSPVPHNTIGPPPQPNSNPGFRFLSGIWLLLLAILALSWPSIPKPALSWPSIPWGKLAFPWPSLPWSKRTNTPIVTPKPGDTEDKDPTKTKVDGPKPPKTNPSTTPDIKPSGSVAVPTKSPEDQKKPDPSTPDNKPSDSGTTPSKLLENLRKHIVGPINNFFPINLDILKSIVYGGLIESITSLGVVSSAVGSGSSTLNVLALGIANLFSGLSLIIYNLYVLIKDPERYESHDIDNERTPAAKSYELLLGNKKNVILHCIVVVVSFIFFGLVPPLSYGYSFKLTTGHYERVLVLVAASLVCVVSLSFAKAHAFKMSKLKIVAEYTGIALGASGLSVITGQFVRDMLEKYDFKKLASAYFEE